VHDCVAVRLGVSVATGNVRCAQVRLVAVAVEERERGVTLAVKEGYGFLKRETREGQLFFAFGAIAAKGEGGGKGSGGKGGASEQRARYLGIRHVLTGVKDKPAALTELQRTLAVSPGECAFVGDDLNDLAVRPVVGLLICPADAVVPLRDRADWVLDRKGGDGAVRRLAEAILQARGDWDRLARSGWRGRND